MKNNSKFKEDFEKIECFICGKKINPKYWIKTDSKYFCSEACIKKYEEKNYGD